jgi:hypothetical protein
MKKYEMKTECCFFNERKCDCNILKEVLCVTKGKCRFYKTRKQYEKDLKKYPWQDDYEPKS